MDFFHCGRCAHWPLFHSEKRVRFFFSSCGKLFCENCLIAISHKCTCGSEQCKFVEIQQQTGKDIRTYFMDPVSLLQDALKKPLQVLQFQSSLQKNCIRIVGKLMESHKTLKNENNSLKLECTRLRQYNEYLEGQIENMARSQVNQAPAFMNPFGGQTQNPNQTFCGLMQQNEAMKAQIQELARSQANSLPSFLNDAPGSGPQVPPFAFSVPRSTTVSPSPNLSFGTPASSISQLGRSSGPSPSPYSRRSNTSSGVSVSGRTPTIINRLRNLKCRAVPGVSPIDPRS